MKINWFKIKTTDSIIPHILNLLIYGNLRNYSIFLNYLKIGIKCKDCNKFYDTCICNWCYECMYFNCLCNISREFESSHIRTLIENWIFYNLSKYHLLTIGVKLNSVNRIRLTAESHRFVDQIVSKLYQL